MARVRCPLLVTQGDQDELIPPDRGAAFAEATGAELVELVDVGHCPHVRHPVRFNELLHDFAARAYGRPAHAAPWRRAMRRPRRALYVSSPIGLGHAWRDVAIARELRALHPDLQIDWLAQDPVTRVLESSGEHIHPASRWLANESRHIAAESREHELNVFQAWRRMDEILLANFMVFRDVVRDEPYDLWIGDEAWELDYYLHENPELKTAPYCFLTDFVGLAADARGRRRRGAADGRLQRRDDRADRPLPERARPGDLRRRAPRTSSPATSATACPRSARGCRSTSTSAATSSRRMPASRTRPRRAACRARLPARRGGLPRHRRRLGRRRRAAAPRHRRLPAGARARVPGLRMIVVCGPRIDPDSLPSHEGLELVTYVDRLSRHLAACDVAVTQGGLTTCMELAAAKTPVRLLPAAPPLRAEPARAPPPGALRGRATPWTWPRATPRDDRRRDRGGAGQGGAAGADVERDGAARAARLIADLL